MQLAAEPEPELSPARSAWTRAGVVRAIKAFAFFRGRPPSRADWRYVDERNGWPSLSIVESLFDSFPAALGAAGLGTPADPRVSRAERSAGHAAA